MVPWISILAAASLYTISSPIQLASAQQVAITSYAPINVTCPSRSLLRSSGTSSQGSQAINAQEALYVQNRKINSVASAFETFLADKNTGYDLSVLAPNATYCVFHRKGFSFSKVVIENHVKQGRL